MKGKPRLLLEYCLAHILSSVSRRSSWNGLLLLGSCLGRLLFVFSPERRGIALNNIRNALNIEDDKEIEDIALRSFKSFFLSYLEIQKIQSRFKEGDDLDEINDVKGIFLRAKEIHDESRGCIFVTPHIGNWELLPYIFSVVDVALAVVVRPLDNPYLERILNREASNQMVVSRGGSILLLKRLLKGGRSIGMLPDQSTMKGLSIDFFGRKAMTTPLPAILAIDCKRPIVVVSCCRGDKHLEGFVSEPIQPYPNNNKRDEIIRITLEMNRVMEGIIRRYPDQYLWMHNRWKVYRKKREFLSK